MDSSTLFTLYWVLTLIFILLVGVWLYMANKVQKIKHELELIDAYDEGARDEEMFAIGVIDKTLGCIEKDLSFIDDEELREAYIEGTESVNDEIEIHLEGRLKELNR